MVEKGERTARGKERERARKVAEGKERSERIT